MPGDDTAIKIAVLEEIVRRLEKALVIQATEYERRLSDLNHAHAEARIKEQEFLPRETYYKSEEQRRTWQEGVDKFRSEFNGKMYASGVMVAMVAGLINIALWAFSIWK